MILKEFYLVFFHKKVYFELEALQVDSDASMHRCNFERIQ